MFKKHFMSKERKREAIKNELMAAYHLLPSDVVESDNGYTEEVFKNYIRANELLLAMEELDGVVENNQSPGYAFWTHLINAAKLMEHLHVHRYKSIRSAR